MGNKQLLGARFWGMSPKCVWCRFGPFLLNKIPSVGIIKESLELVSVVAESLNYILSGASIPSRLRAFLNTILVASTRASLASLNSGGLAFITGNAL